MLIELLTYRFGALDDRLRNRLRQLNSGQLAAMPLVVFDARSLDEITSYLDSFAAE